MNDKRVRCAEAALENLPRDYLLVSPQDLAAQESGHSFHKGLHIGWAWGEDKRSGRVFLDFLDEHRMSGTSASRYFADGSSESLPTPATFRQTVADPVEDAKLEAAFFERNKKAYEYLRDRGLLPPEGENLFSQDLNEFLLTGGTPAEPSGAEENAQNVAALTLGHIVTSLGADHDPPITLQDILVIRHAYKPSGHDGLQGPEDLTEERVWAYTREQNRSTKAFPAKPPRYWVVLAADGKTRSRLFGVYENHGELVAERTETNRYWDLRRAGFLQPLESRLVVDWTSRGWYRWGKSAATLPVLEIADRDKVPFPGFDQVLLSWHELQDVIADPRYADWRAALSEVQGVYLITDTSTGKQYVGKADGAQRLLGRWSAYARNGHGGNVALRELAKAAREAGTTLDGSTEEHARHFRFSILRVFGPSTPTSEVDAAEGHFKEALMTRTWGLNRN